MSHTVLVIDDEVATRRLVAYTLRTMENVVVADADNATAALALLEQQQVDLALVDINLPDMDGFALMQRMRALPQMRDVPIVVFTARSHQDDETRAQELGANGFFYKPFSTAELRRIVVEQLKL